MNVGTIREIKALIIQGQKGKIDCKTAVKMFSDLVGNNLFREVKKVFPKRWNYTSVTLSTMQSKFNDADNKFHRVAYVVPKDRQHYGDEPYNTETDDTAKYAAMLQFIEDFNKIMSDAIIELENEAIQLQEWINSIKKIQA